MQNNNIIETRNLCYSYEGGELALDNVSIEIERGKTTAILGGNGAGKSTLFLNLNGVLRPQSGDIYIAGKKLEYSRKGILDMRRTVGIVFQDPDHQLFSADVYRDISFGAVNLGLPEDEVRRRVDDAMEKTGVSHLAKRPTHALSYGQKKRVAIAGVLVMQPELIILDEPTAGLDPQGVSEIMKLLDEIKAKTGISVVIATHDIDMVPLYSDKVYIMNSGRVVSGGTSKEIFSDPDVIRENNLRLPRIEHLMEILREKDGLDVDKSAATIGEARIEILKVLRRDI
ncbi:ATP-binding cassette domain-containing protein [Proteocatella sphenisci]|uniref:ATP-binding cassette domain-containing protein n=1 Tax=Proteocatella sphenisci TaxID=181070 RepID=UPI0004B5970C|nr:ATP-binding cassette domain-containing protein [Proteocatella sphenisci]